MVMQKSVIKYMTRMGQKTGILKNSKKVQAKAIRVAFVAEYQNLNSGRRLWTTKVKKKSVYLLCSAPLVSTVSPLT